MAVDTTHDDFLARPSDGLLREDAALEAARAQAMAEIALSRAAVSSKAELEGSTADYSMHDVAGVGRYVIPRRQGWKPLLNVIHDPVPNVDFSANIYPAFDGIIGERFQSPYLLDPLHDKYESYEGLRDNLAAVRNFLMQSYYADSPDGVTPVKAKIALAEIATFVGDGLYNNFRLLHVVPNHNPTKDFIDIDEARRPNGEGAQYIYDKILEKQRHSNWMKPFTAVIELFGGKPVADWKLPDASKTHFTDMFEQDIVNGTVGTATAVAATTTLEAATARLAEIDAKRADLSQRKALNNIAVDLDAIGNHLLFTAENMAGVAHMSEPTRRDAVNIAKDILRKLKVSIGQVEVLDGLKLKPTDDLAVLGSVKGVAMVYERLLAWARGNNDAELLQHPSILAATRAIGQLGYLAKVEAKTMALAAGNTVMAEAISAQIARVPASYVTTRGTTFGALLDTVEHGIDTVLNRTQEVSVSGAKVGLSVENRGTTMDAPPTAGAANQLGAAQTAALAAAQAAQLATLAHMQHVASQQNASGNPQPRPQQGQLQPSQAAAAPQRSGANAARTNAQPNRTARGTTSSISAPPNGTMTPAQLAAMRTSASARAAHAAHEREEAHHHEMQAQQQLRDAQARAQKAASKAAIAKIDPALLGGFKNTMSVKGLAANPALAPGRRIDPNHVTKESNKAQALAQAQASKATEIASPSAQTPEQQRRDQLLNPTPGRGPRDTGGRGF